MEPGKQHTHAEPPGDLRPDTLPQLSSREEALEVAGTIRTLNRRQAKRQTILVFRSKLDSDVRKDI